MPQFSAQLHDRPANSRIDRDWPAAAGNGAPTRPSIMGLSRRSWSYGGIESRVNGTFALSTAQTLVTRAIYQHFVRHSAIQRQDDRLNSAELPLRPG
jgi:hypothetical protein